MGVGSRLWRARPAALPARLPSGVLTSGVLTSGVLASSILACLAAGPAGAVVGGRDAADAPLARRTAMVLSSKGGVCSAIVVTPTILLTAAHCASGAGEYRAHYKGLEGEPVLIPLVSVARHPGYDAGAVAGRRRSIDLALLRLAGPLPPPHVAATLSGAVAPAGTTLTLGGYGVAREGDGRSSGTFRIAALPVVEPYGRGTILVWLKGETSGACEGDSGGPVAGASGGVIAVTAYARGRGRGCGELSQGTLVGPHRAWIDRVLMGWGAAALWE